MYSPLHLLPIVLPESGPTWQCWGRRWTSDAADNRWDTAPPSSHWAGLPLARRPPRPPWLSAPGFPVSISLAWGPWCYSAGSLCWPPAAALRRLADTLPGEFGLLRCPGVKHKQVVAMAQCERSTLTYLCRLFLHSCFTKPPWHENKNMSSLKNVKSE